MQDFPSSWKEWKETVTPCYSEVFRLMKIINEVLSLLQSDLKNLKKMDEVWEVLKEEFGQVMESIHSLVKSLTNFKYSKDTKSEDLKFTRL